jgi:hypothetical protein
MKRDESLQRVLWCAVMFICLAFFCFAVTVTILERMPTEPAVVTVVYEPAEIGKPKMQAAMPIPATQAAPAGLDPMVEGTYLREDIPLSYELQCDLYGACLEFEIDYDLALAVIEQETRFQNVTGDGGDSQGYMQIQRKWWNGLMAEIGAEDLTNPEDNFRTGCAILRQLIDRYGNVEDALTAYNSGKPGSSNYSRQVMERMKNYG